MREALPPQHLSKQGVATSLLEVISPLSKTLIGDLS
jgi:hypothetical protein